MQAGNSVVDRSVQALAQTRGDSIVKLGDLNLIQNGQTLSIVAHGSPTSLGGLTSTELVAILTANGYRGSNIELLACRTGSARYAQEVATGMNATVTAPKYNVNILSGIYGVPQVRDPLTGLLAQPGTHMSTFQP